MTTKYNTKDTAELILYPKDIPLTVVHSTKCYTRENKTTGTEGIKRKRCIWSNERNEKLI